MTKLFRALGIPKIQAASMKPIFINYYLIQDKTTLLSNKMFQLTGSANFDFNCTTTSSSSTTIIKVHFKIFLQKKKKKEFSNMLDVNELNTLFFFPSGMNSSPRIPRFIQSC